MPRLRPAAIIPTFLVTGFEPFGGDACNPSWEIAARLDGWEVPPWPGAILGATSGAAASPLAVVRAARLPCVFGEALVALDEAIERHRPMAVIALGLAASRQEISVERIAINVDDARIPDNAGCRPVDAPVCADGPAAYWSSLPIKAIVAALREAGVPASISQSAGTFVCNHVFYGLAHRLAGAVGPGDGAREAASAMPPRFGGFIHVPWPGRSNSPPDVQDLSSDLETNLETGLKTGLETDRAPDPAPDLETQVAAIRIAVQVTLATGGSDVRLPGGAID